MYLDAFMDANKVTNTDKMYIKLPYSGPILIKTYKSARTPIIHGQVL